MRGEISSLSQVVDSLLTSMKKLEQQDAGKTGHVVHGPARRKPDSSWARMTCRRPRASIGTTWCPSGEWTNALLRGLRGMPSIDPTTFKDLILRPSYTEIKHTLNGPNSIFKSIVRMKMIQLRMSGVMEVKLGHLNMDYALSEHSRALCGVWSGFEEPFDDDDATDEE
ncbi:hypothetical protein HAX54_007863 [Datura stramonium]|uniref:Uncharacterized protein n=1 Tax=Datura stramonium TaxID=4076 RepID=A0ABS8TEY4_DATST|nr:hypothetical protein [Datura stramonium]